MPKVDFDKYTIVYGCFWGISGTGFNKSNIKVKATKDGAIVKVPVYLPSMGFCDWAPHFFWNLYPKFSASKTTVEKFVKD